MKRELLIMPNNLGDVIMAIPVIRGIKKRRFSEVHFMVEKGFEGGLLSNPFCDKILTFDRKSVRDLWNEGDIAGSRKSLADFIAETNRYSYDTVINLSQLKHSSFISSLIRSSSRFGRVFLHEGNHAVLDKWSQYLYAIPFARSCNRLHATDVYCRAARVRHKKSVSCDIVVSESEQSQAIALLQQKGVAVGEKKIAFLQPGAALPSKRWPPQNFVQLGRMLTDNGWDVVISGAPAEAAVAGDIAKSIGERCVCLAGETTFREAVATLTQATVCVTGDTAIMHAAAGLKKNVYALFGSTNPVETGPYGEGHWVFAGRCTSRPCFCENCKSTLCMKSILPQTVFACIMHNNPGDAKTCDIYRSSFDSYGYTLLPVAKSSMPYYDRVSAYFVLSAFESVADNDRLNNTSEMDVIFESCALLLSRLETMRSLLINPTSKSVHEYEQVKASLSSLTGVGAFFFALLNIRLNSVPILDVRKGIEMSVVQIEQMKAMIKHAVRQWHKK